MFKFRFGPGAQSASAQPTSLDAIRRRARHRLMGASVLVLLGIVGLPWLFDTQPRPIPVDIAIDIPAKDTAPPLTLPAPVPPVPQSAPPAAESTATPVDSVAPAPVAAVPPVVSLPPAEPPQASAAPQATTPSADAVRVVVQVGAFAEPSRVRQVRQRLESAGLTTYTQVAKTPDGPRTRVRVGPFDSQAEAQRVAEKIKALGMPADLLTLQ